MMNRPSQKDLFLASEGDQYYDRNRNKLTVREQQSSDQILADLKRANLQVQNILEIGCSNGWRLETLRNLYNARCFDIDPSSIAIHEGTAWFPDLSLRVGTADKLPFEDDKFDLVIFGFCLYLCDREDLFRIVYEADRVLMDTGYISILDFYPPFPYRNMYEHTSGIYSYKMDYSKMFLWNPAYTLVSRSVFTHYGLTRIDEPNERLSVAILRKNSQYAYPDNPFVSGE